MSELSNIKTLEELFEYWKTKQSNDSGKETCNSENGYVVATNSFYKDGIVNPEEYQNSALKVLFITNDVSIDCKNDVDEKNPELKGNGKGGHLVGNNKGNTVCSFNRYISDDEQETWSGKMRIKFGEMYRIMTEENYKTKDSIDAKANKEALKKIAFMNLNKRGGFGSIQRDVFLNYLKKYKECIRKEIELIAPDVIVWCACNTYDAEEYMGAIFEEKVWKEKKLTLKKGKVPILRMWHPSVQGRNMNEYLEKFADDVWKNAKDVI